MCKTGFAYVGQQERANARAFCAARRVIDVRCRQHIANATTRDEEYGKNGEMKTVVDVGGVTLRLRSVMSGIGMSSQRSAARRQRHASEIHAVKGVESWVYSRVRRQHDHGSEVHAHTPGYARHIKYSAATATAATHHMPAHSAAVCCCASRHTPPRRRIYALYWRHA